MCCELPLELSFQLFGTWLGYLAAQALALTGPGLLSRELFHVVLAFEVIRSLVVAVMEGHDSNHQAYSIVVPRDPHTFLVGPEYHAMHHVNTSAYITSSFKVFDWFLGTAYTLKSRRITTVGLSGTLGEAMQKELTQESLHSTHELSMDVNNEEFVETMTDTDVLIINYDVVKYQDCETVDIIIELFRKHNKPRPGSLLLPEIWCICNRSGLNSEKSCFSRARTYHKDDDVVYRQIILPDFTSKLGTAVIRP